jgi:hypothetical protein
MDIINFINSSKLSQNLMNGAGKELASCISSQAKLERVESIFKLIYNLFLYSVLGFFAKIVMKLFKI